MKPTDFAKHLTDFLSKYLPGERGVSTNTIRSYRDSFVLFIAFMEQRNVHLRALTLEKITKESIVDFLEWLQSKRHCGDATRNLRLAALHSFFKYVQYQHPEKLHEFQQILSIQTKKTEKPSMSYLSIDGIRLLLDQPDGTTQKGRRDLALLCLMYDTGARVQEIIDLTPSRVRFEKPCTILITGKGKKNRIVPLLDAQVVLLKHYMIEHKLMEPNAGLRPLFSGKIKDKLTRAGISHILAGYVLKAQMKSPCIISPKNKSPCT